VKALEQKVDSTLQDILGHETVEYNQYSTGILELPPDSQRHGFLGG
jgi:hypothetical protein